MTAIALETEIVASSFDPRSRICTYTIQRDGKRWTVSLPADEFRKFKGTTAKQQKRNHLANALMRAMTSSPPDPPRGIKTDPHKPATWDDFDKVKSGAWYINPSDGKLQQKP